MAIQAPSDDNLKSETESERDAQIEKLAMTALKKFRLPTSAMPGLRLPRSPFDKLFKRIAMFDRLRSPFTTILPQSPLDGILKASDWIDRVQGPLFSQVKWLEDSPLASWPPSPPRRVGGDIGFDRNLAYAVKPRESQETRLLRNILSEIRKRPLPEESTANVNYASTQLSEMLGAGVPGRPSSRDLVMAEFDRRTALRQLEENVTAQARVLAAWLKETHPEAPSAQMEAIRNMIRAKYRTAKPSRANSRGRDNP